jgi:serine/threonine-protein kinase
VAGQEPEARTQAPTGSRVVLTVRGPRPVVVPEVRGLDATAVASALTGADLRLGPVAARYDAAVPSGTVLTQEPAPRTIAPARALVSITVSKGPRPVRVPAVLGARTAQARVTLQRAGFGARITPVTSVSPSGTVLAQEPGPGRLARPGSSVQLIVSRGTQTEP